MKTLSIREPYATLIKNKIKYVETRSWKTNYRGKVLIHSCKGKFQIKDKVKNLVNVDELKYGYIICEADLIDCIFIDENYANKMKKENLNNYLCGDYSVGRYAWVLSNIRLIKPIAISGQLGLWNYEGELKYES